MRTGSEPRTARSPLRARFWLSVWGLLWAVLGTAAFVLAGRPGWAVACGVLSLVIAVDMAMILRHLRQGPHYQPGRDIPPYRPPDAGPPRPRPPYPRPPHPGPPGHRHP
ncbi:hypothetical protein D9753_26715 [Streptomyces dangxiongensis]|uniref:Uncharacterized protein n=1 Tax=Streptomyces dangxiongensis TaxID=1442032 RepID=A0A3G2JPQ8_9ACTN|nr:DUF6343 family protein [Streptomyces dangxiongensis]AYN41877.1 hypothetical protein D9753_26715 [Streptomyces dangxiongensis]